MSTALYENLTRELLLRRQVSPSTYYRLSGGGISLDQCCKRFTPAIAHCKKNIKPCGIECPKTIRDGRLIYRIKAIPADVHIDFLVAEKTAAKGMKCLEAKSLPDAMALAQEAIKECADSPMAQRLWHHVCLVNPHFDLCETQRAARATSMRRESVRTQIACLEEIATDPDWAIHRELIRAQLHHLHAEYEDLLFLAIRSEMRMWPILSRNEDDRSFGELCALSVLAKRLTGKAREFYFKGVMEHPITTRITREMVTRILSQWNPKMPIQPSRSDVHAIAIQEVSRAISDTLDMDNFASLAGMRAYIRARCQWNIRAHCVADQYGLDPAAVARAYRKWNFERKRTEAKLPPPSQEEIRKHLGLSRPEHSGQYDSMIAAEETMRHERFSFDHTDNFDDTKPAEYPPEILQALSSKEEMPFLMVRKLLREAPDGFHVNIERWLKRNNGLGRFAPDLDTIKSTLKLSNNAATDFLKHLSKILDVVRDEGEER